MRKIIILPAIILIAHYNSKAHGCLAVRQMGGVAMCSSESYNLTKEISLRVPSTSISRKESASRMLIPYCNNSRLPIS